MIVSESAIDTLTTKPIGTGPFRFVEYRPGDQLVVEKNPDYFLPGVPKLDRAILRIIPESTTAVAGARKRRGRHRLRHPAGADRQAQDSSVARVEEVQAGPWQGIILNCQIKPFDDPRVREAFIKLIDKPAFTDIATFGHGTPTVTPIPPMHPYFRKDLPLAAPTSPARRNCWPRPGFASGWESKCSCRAATRRWNGWPPRSATPPSRWASPSSCASCRRTSSSPRWKARCRFSVDNFYGRTTPDLMLYAWYHSTGSWNNTLWHYNNPEVDKILDAARATADKAEQARAVRPVPGDRRQGRAWQHRLRAELRLRRQQEGAGLRWLAADVRWISAT